MHVFSNPQSLLDFIKYNKSKFEELTNTKKIDRIQFRVTEDDGTITVLRGGYWLKTSELHLWLNHFYDIYLNNIERIEIAYISGLMNPLGANTKQMVHHTGDYYEAHCRIIRR